MSKVWFDKHLTNLRIKICYTAGSEAAAKSEREDAGLALSRTTLRCVMIDFFLVESNDEIIKVLRTIHSVICHINSKSIPMSKTFIKQDRYILYIELLGQLKTCLVTESSTGNAILFI